MQQSLPLGPLKAQFYFDGRHYSVHREGQTVIITYSSEEIRRFSYATERTALEQQAQLKIQDVDPLLVLDDSEDDNADT